MSFFLIGLLMYDCSVIFRVVGDSSAYIGSASCGSAIGFSSCSSGYGGISNGISLSTNCIDFSYSTIPTAPLLMLN